MDRSANQRRWTSRNVSKAIRFLDGEVLRGHLDGTLERHRYGVVLHLNAEHSDSPVRKLGIPFSAVKALFFDK